MKKKFFLPNFDFHIFFVFPAFSCVIFFFYRFFLISMIEFFKGAGGGYFFQKFLFTFYHFIRLFIPSVFSENLKLIREKLTKLWSFQLTHLHIAFQLLPHTKEAEESKKGRFCGDNGRKMLQTSETFQINRCVGFRKTLLTVRQGIHFSENALFKVF